MNDDKKVGGVSGALDPSKIDLSAFSIAGMDSSEEKPKPQPKKRKIQSRCEDCEFFECDDDGDYYCSVSLDEDEMAEFLSRNTGRCPYYRFYDEYKSVQKQN